MNKLTRCVYQCMVVAWSLPNHNLYKCWPFSIWHLIKEFGENPIQIKDSFRKSSLNVFYKISAISFRLQYINTASLSQTSHFRQLRTTIYNSKVKFLLIAGTTLSGPVYIYIYRERQNSVVIRSIFNRHVGLSRNKLHHSWDNKMNIWIYHSHFIWNAFCNLLVIYRRLLIYFIV